MKKGDDQTKTVVYVLIAFAAGAALAYFVMGAQSGWGYGVMGPGMMWGSSGYGMMNYMQQYRNTVDADCKTITTDELEEIGDYVMGQMIGDERVHETVDQTHPNIDAMHLTMGRIATGCY